MKMMSFPGRLTTIQLRLLLQRDGMKRGMLSWRSGESVWMEYPAPIMGEGGPLLPGYAEAFGFIYMMAEAMGMRNTVGSGLADMVTKEAE